MRLPLFCSIIHKKQARNNVILALLYFIFKELPYLLSHESFLQFHYAHSLLPL